MYIFDIETDGLYDYTKIHCLAYANVDTGKINTLTNYEDIVKFFLDNETFIGHNILRYDIKVLEDILKVNFKDRILVDTLGLSYYLYPNKKTHSLEHYGEEYKIPKVKIDDWKGLTREDYIKRCERDVQINLRLWKDQYSYLRSIYDTENGVWKLIAYVTHKLYCARLAEEDPWKFDIEGAKNLLDIMQKEFKPKKQELESYMPKVPVIKKIKRPAKMKNKGGDWSARAVKWFTLDGDNNSEEKEYIDGYMEPNSNSHQQVKDWLYSLGWKPETFKYNKKGEAIPQIMTEDKSICPSIEVLAEKEPGVHILEGYSVLKHRIPYVQSLINDSIDGYISSEIAGFTNTMRFLHSKVVNVPGVDKPWGKEIRSLFGAKDGYEVCGSDMSSLEDRTKQHFIYPYDPEYVKEMDKPDFDPHLDIAVLANMMTGDDAEAYKAGDMTVKPIRHKAKTTNYSCTYGAYPPRIARDGNMSLEDATQLWESFWKRNWAIKKVVENLRTKEVNGQTWLFNPLSRLWYFLKHDKDKFSTLNQGTGAYCFDMWLYFILQERPQLTAQYHDEIVLQVKKGYREEVTHFLNKCIDEVNEHLNLNRTLGVDVKFGQNYSEVH